MCQTMYTNPVTQPNPLITGLVWFGFDNESMDLMINPTQ
jgi:hypothetical protein